MVSYIFGKLFIRGLECVVRWQDFLELMDWDRMCKEAVTVASVLSGIRTRENVASPKT